MQVNHPGGSVTGRAAAGHATFSGEYLRWRTRVGSVRSTGIATVVVGEFPAIVSQHGFLTVGLIPGLPEMFHPFGAPAVPHTPHDSHGGLVVKHLNAKVNREQLQDHKHRPLGLSTEESVTFRLAICDG